MSDPFDDDLDDHDEPELDGPAEPSAVEDPREVDLDVLDEDELDDEELVATDDFPPGFFPTMRNPQLERFESWHDKWTDTVMAVHTRLRNSEVR